MQNKQKFLLILHEGVNVLFINVLRVYFNLKYTRNCSFRKLR